MKVSEFKTELDRIDRCYFTEELRSSEAYMCLYRLTVKILEELNKQNALPDSVQEALNSGDGVYRP